MGAAVGILVMASATCFAVACSSSSDTGDTRGDRTDAGPANVGPPGAGGGGSQQGGDSGGPGSGDDIFAGGCAPVNGSYDVTYRETDSAGTGCELVDGGSRTAIEAYPAEAVPGDGGLPDGCACNDSSLTCTFSSTLRGVSTSTTTLDETFTANGWTGTVSHRVNNLDGGVIYLCTQSVSATKSAR
jgi:hypothetical protein